MLSISTVCATPLEFKVKLLSCHHPNFGSCTSGVRNINPQNTPVSTITRTLTSIAAKMDPKPPTCERGTRCGNLNPTGPLAQNLSHHPRSLLGLRRPMGLAVGPCSAPDWTVVPTFDFPFRFSLLPAGNFVPRYLIEYSKIKPLLFMENTYYFPAISLLVSNYSLLRKQTHRCAWRDVGCSQGAKPGRIEVAVEPFRARYHRNPTDRIFCCPPKMRKRNVRQSSFSQQVSKWPAREKQTKSVLNGEHNVETSSRSTSVRNNSTYRSAN